MVKNKKFRGSASEKSKVILKALTGGAAAAEAMRQINPDVFSAYPITPQTPIIQSFAQLVADKKVETNFILVESEHSAMSVVIGAEAAGGRAMTATASQGLILMSEVLSVASGLRLPIVMNIATRALSAPINIHNDHQDAMAIRDLGWIQIFCENNQEVYENNLLALRLAEDLDVQLPVMVCQDGFITSHNTEGVNIYPDTVIKKFLGEYEPRYPLLNLEKPVTIGPLVLPDYYFEIRTQISRAMNQAKKKYIQVGKKLENITGHQYKYFEKYRMDNAQAAVVALGSTAGTTKTVIDELRKQGKKVGLLKINLFRPFPYEQVAKALSNVKFIGILERSTGFGSYSPLVSEIRHCLSNLSALPCKTKRAGRSAQGYIFGLGGRDIQPQEIESVFKQLLKGQISDQVEYIGLRLAKNN